MASTVSFPVAQHRSTETSAQAEVDEEFQTPAESVFTKDVSNLMEEIHKENEQKLANMTETEILATRNQLLAKLG